MIHIDFETRSEIDLTKTGPYIYAIHPSTEIICMGYKIGSAATKIWLPGLDLDLPDCIYSAFNVGFEYNIWNEIMHKKYNYGIKPIEQWHCSAALNAQFGLPQTLEKTAIILQLKNQKDREGNAIIKKICNLRPNWTRNKKGPKWFDFDLEKICEYCKQDVETEYELTCYLSGKLGN